MFGIPMLDVLIGLIFMYLLLALVCTSFNEMIAGWRDSREKHLRAGISNLLGEVGSGLKRRPMPFHDPLTGKPFPLADTTAEATIVSAFYAHPLIKALHEDGTPPSYIPAGTFSQVILDLFAPSDGKTPRSIPAFINGVNNALAANPDLRRTLLVISEDAADMAQMRAALETWFNNTMERVSAWYKNRSQKTILFVSLGICFAINADSIQLAKDLYKNPAHRTEIVHQADQAIKTGALTREAGVKLTTELARYNSSGFSWGWGKDYEFIRDFNRDNLAESALKVLGILLTAIAASLGAPFWFDMLNKLVNIRAVGKPPEPPAPAAPARLPTGPNPEGVGLG